MKIDLAVWTAVNGYDWQPGSVYSPKELAGYKDEIGALVPDSLPLGGLFLKDGRAVFYRVQIAERMDSRGRGAIYCVLGTVPEDRAKEIDFSVVFNSAEMAQPRKPFPTAIECHEGGCEYKLSLGRSAFNERRFTGAETFSELGGWCDEARHGELSVRITGSMETPLFTVVYKPYSEQSVAPREPKPGQSSRPTEEFPPTPRYPSPGKQAQIFSRPSYADDETTRRVNDAEKEVKKPKNPFFHGFMAGMISGVVATAFSAWIVCPGKNVSFMEPNIVEQQGVEQRSAATNDDAQTGFRHDAAIKTIEDKREHAVHPSEDRRTMYPCPSCNGIGGVVSDPRRKDSVSHGGFLTCKRCEGKGIIEMRHSGEER